jgi:hypothetical protein
MATGIFDGYRVVIMGPSVDKDVVLIPAGTNGPYSRRDLVRLSAKDVGLYAGSKKSIYILQGYNNKRCRWYDIKAIIPARTNKAPATAGNTG